MKKTILSFAAGQAATLLLLYVGQSMTFANNLFGFCFGVDIIILVALIVGAWGSFIERETKREFVGEFPEGEEVTLPQIFGKHVKDIEEAPPIPEEFEVSNDSIRRTE